MSFTGNYTFYSVITQLSSSSITPTMSARLKYYDYPNTGWGSGTYYISFEQIEFVTSSTSFTFNSSIGYSGSATVSVIGYTYYIIRIA